MAHYTVKQMTMRHPAFSESSFRWLIFNEKENGLHPAIIRVGRKVLINEMKFLRWIEDNQCLINEIKKQKQEERIG